MHDSVVVIVYDGQEYNARLVNFTVDLTSTTPGVPAATPYQTSGQLSHSFDSLLLIVLICILVPVIIAAVIATIVVIVKVCRAAVLVSNFI